MISILSFNFTPWAVVGCSAFIAGLSVAAYAMGCYATNKKRDVGYAVFCDNAMKKENADVRAQNKVLGTLLAEKERRITDLEVRNRAAQHLAKQCELALTPGVDITGGAK